MKKRKIVGLIGGLSGLGIIFLGAHLLTHSSLFGGLIVGGIALMALATYYNHRERRKEREAKTWCRFCGSEVKNGGDPICEKCRRIIVNITE